MKEQKGILRSLSMLFQFSLSMLVPLGIFLGIGIWLEPYIGMVGLLVCMVIGLLAGMRSAWVLASKMVGKDEQEEESYNLMEGWEDSKEDSGEA